MTTPEADARRAWAALDRQARREVRDSAHRGRLHPDPAVAAVSVRYAKAETARSSEFILRLKMMLLGMPCLVLVAIADGLDTSRPSHGHPRLGGVLVLNLMLALLFIVCATFTVRAWSRWNRFSLLRRIEDIDWTASGTETAHSGEPALENSAGGEAGASLAVRYAPRLTFGGLAGTVVFACLMAYYLQASVSAAHGAARVAFAVILVIGGAGFLAMIALQVRLLVRWVIPGRPVIGLDAGGVHLHAFGLIVPWPAVTEIMLARTQSGWRPGRPVMTVGFVCADAEALLGAARLTRLGRRMQEKVHKRYGTPFVFSDVAFDHTAEQIATAANRLADVPVRRL